jgi:RNA polymerase sigma-70 factor (ECF subfamily)
MMLVELFRQHAAPALWAAFAAHTSFEETLWRLHREGQAAWPQFQLTPAQLTAFLARQLPAEAAEPQALATLRVRELYLLCAFGLHDRQAQAVIEAEYMPRVRQVLLQQGTPEAVIADIQQELCSRLIERQDPTVERRGYAGRGDLGSWLSTTAVREAGLRRKRGQREVAFDPASQSALPDQRNNPETTALTGNLKDALKAAFREALASLSSRERNLLRYHFLAALSAEQIGDIYRVHRATAARWVARAQEQLTQRTRDCFVRRTQVSEESLPHVMAELHSQLSMNLESLLKGTAEHDPSAQELHRRR